MFAGTLAMRAERADSLRCLRVVQERGDDPATQSQSQDIAGEFHIDADVDLLDAAEGEEPGCFGSKDLADLGRAKSRQFLMEGHGAGNLTVRFSPDIDAFYESSNSSGGNTPASGRTRRRHGGRQGHRSGGIISVNPRNREGMPMRTRTFYGRRTIWARHPDSGSEKPATVCPTALATPTDGAHPSKKHSLSS